MNNHDLLDGPQTKCQICGNIDLQTVIDLGNQPLADKLSSIENAYLEETSYPLEQKWCNICGLNQLSYITPAEIMFGDNYNYKTGVTKELIVYQAEMATELVSSLDIKNDDLVCDLGSNDGTLLKGFKKNGVRVIGVEPTNIADIANLDGIKTLRMPFGKVAANKVIKIEGKATLATATNVFAHVQKLGDFIEGLDIVLHENGWFCFENHYLAEIMDATQYDTIYHEHLRSLSISAVVHLFSQYNFSVVRVQQTSRYGGNIRVTVRKGSHNPIDDSVKNFLQREKDLGFFKQDTYENFKQRIISSKITLLKKLINLKEEGKSVAGYSLPARAMTLINYVGLDHNLLPYVVEQPSSLKLNKFIPGTRIPVISNACLESECPDYLVIFAWHLQDEIIQHLRERGLKAVCIIPLPEVKLIEL
ncbi:MAG: methyltransferase domain-containing protein [Rickettsiales bacterium TMED289]|nr:MAG: methyltransferase domain-containing protein [Rickettsiales bacterium TMED289]|tara:strand:- start:4963 stop:6219 length:1257 start_codon:yes stop_codon:yes gene_type:complete